MGMRVLFVMENVFDEKQKKRKIKGQTLLLKQAWLKKKLAKSKQVIQR